MTGDKFSHPEIEAYLRRVAESEVDPMRRAHAVDAAKQKIDRVLPENPSDADVTWALSELGVKGSDRSAKVSSQTTPVGTYLLLFIGALFLFWVVTTNPYMGVFWGLILIALSVVAKRRGYGRAVPYIKKFGVVTTVASVILVALLLVEKALRAIF